MFEQQGLLGEKAGSRHGNFSKIGQKGPVGAAHSAH